jgi:hypothetical protein
MIHGGQKFQKPEKTKFKKNRNEEEVKLQKKRHHDKSLYRLVKQEKEDYVL